MSGASESRKLSDGVVKASSVSLSISAAEKPSSASFSGTPLALLHPGEECYFIHSYEAKPADDADRLADTRYGGRAVCAAAMRGSVLGCQFHPEKSGDVGLRILQQFLQMR